MKILRVPDDWVVDEIRNSWGAADGGPQSPPEASEAAIGAPPEAGPKVSPEAGPVGPRAPTKAGASLTRALPKRTWSSISGVTN